MGIVIFISLTVVAFIHTLLFRRKEEIEPDMLAAIVAAINLYRKR